jgi:methionyl-tRNA synthetase
VSSRVLVTSALPYANGPAHLGHLVEYVQTDVWVRYLKLTGRDVIYVWASDTHGAPIELNAAKTGQTPEAFVRTWHDEHRRTFTDFLIGFDVFYLTHSPENRRWSEEIYRRLAQGGHITERALEQWYCETDARFLPDRFVKGTCPNCGAADQYGDVCEVCGKTYASVELKAPACAICKNPPIRRSSQHLFFQLSHFRALLDRFTAQDGVLHPAVRNSVRAWIDAGLEDWCVSRDGPYFGFEIPGAPGKYFYVWLDAPIGYLSSTEHLVGAERALRDYWGQGADCRIVHFIGKDIVYFHALFWPAMLDAAQLKLPDRVQVHGMLTFNGEKLSKSRGKMVTGRQYLDAGLDPEALRWFYASNLTAAPNDLALSAEEIKNRVNAELVKTLANFVVRALTPLKKDLGGVIAAIPSDDASQALWARAKAASKTIAAAYEAIELREACQEIVRLGFDANKYLQERAPWSKRKQGDQAGARADLSLCANVAYVLGVWLSPILPKKAKDLVAMLGGVPLDPAKIEAAAPPLAPGTVLGEIVHLAAPIQDEALDRLWPEAPATLVAPMAAPVAASDGVATKGTAGAGAQGKAVTGAGQGAGATSAPAGTPGLVTYDDFGKVNLRVGKIAAAEKVQGADKLLKLAVDLGESAPRTIVAGIAQSYAPEAVVGLSVVVVANLAPRRLRGIESHGMLLAAGGDGEPLRLVQAPDAAPGTVVK